MKEAMAEQKTERNGRGAKMSVEVRLLTVACLCFMTAQYVVNGHSLDRGFQRLDQGFRIAALLAFIAAQFVGFRARGAQRS